MIGYAESTWVKIWKATHSFCVGIALGVFILIASLIGLAWAVGMPVAVITWIGGIVIDVEEKRKNDEDKLDNRIDAQMADCHKRGGRARTDHSPRAYKGCVLNGVVKP